MVIRQRQKRNEDAVARQPSATPLADAAMIGGLAGGLVMAIAEANAGEPRDDKTAALATPGLGLAPEQQRSAADQANVAVVAHERPAAVADPAVEQAEQPTASLAAYTPDAPVAADTLDPAVETIASQIADTVVRVAQSMAAGVDSDVITTDIVGAAREIAARLQPEPADTVVTNLAEQILDAVDPTAIVDHSLAATQDIAGNVIGLVVDGTDIAQSVLDDVSGLTGNTLALVADLPVSLLGFEGSDMPGGLLSDFFYDDGQADAPPLSDLASLVPTDAPLSLSMLGQGYGDADLGHLPVNALGLL